MLSPLLYSTVLSPFNPYIARSMKRRKILVFEEAGAMGAAEAKDYSAGFSGGSLVLVRVIWGDGRQELGQDNERL
jgi:hypothetical protein